MSFQIDLSTAFYDVMFGKPDETSVILNSVEQAVCDEISILLEHKDISSLVPSLPTQVLQINKAVSDPHTDFHILSNIIETDVALAGEIVSKANAPAFRRTAKPIESIKDAVASLGLSGVGSIANNVLMKRVLDIKPIYFRKFGKQIWEHSEDCALVCRYLSEDQDIGTCYLLGLLHDVGKVVMFKCLVNGFKRADPSSAPGGKLFKEMMVRYSLWLSWRIAESWGMPENIVNALEQQRNDSEHAELALVLHKSNFLCELYLLSQAAHLTLDDAAQTFGLHGCSQEQGEKVFALLDKNRD